MKIFYCVVTAGIFLSFSVNTKAQCRVASVIDGNFSGQKSSRLVRYWETEGKNVSVELNGKESRSRSNNVLIKDGKGYSGIKQFIRLQKGVTYTLKIFVKTSPTFAENRQSGVFGFKDPRTRKIIMSKELSAKSRYQEVSITFSPTVSQDFQIFAGFTGRETNDWIRIDDVSIKGNEPPCEDSVGNPV